MASIHQSQEAQTPIIILMMRWHGLNRCKSRLAKEIGAIQASRIQEKLTLHTLSVAKRVSQMGLAEIQVAISGIGPKAAQRWAAMHSIKYLSFQRFGNLGERMRKEFLKAQFNKTRNRFQKRPTILIGTDLPLISANDLIDALKALRKKDIVLGPAIDGGYWLIGFSHKIITPDCRWPFCEIPWGEKEVLTKTIQIALQHSFNYHLLRYHNDIDRISDLEPWHH